jgi:hypothetical protein
MSDTNCEVAERSYEPITREDLKRLAMLTTEAFDTLFAKPRAKSRIYKGRLLLLALCQGAALHYLDGRNGVKDLDVWGFFRAHPDRPFPPRAHWYRDFGLSHLGRHPHPSRIGYKGRVVDLLGRSIEVAPGEDGVSAVRRWLSHPRGKSSAYHLAKRAVVAIHPPELLGEIIWPV